jgi:hypothetical protein
MMNIFLILILIDRIGGLLISWTLNYYKSKTKFTKFSWYNTIFEGIVPGTIGYIVAVFYGIIINSIIEIYRIRKNTVKKLN